MATTLLHLATRQLGAAKAQQEVLRVVVLGDQVVVELIMELLVELQQQDKEMREQMVAAQPVVEAVEQEVQEMEKMVALENKA